MSNPVGARLRGTKIEAADHGGRHLESDPLRIAAGIPIARSFNNA
jgi:hypothetical protein